MKSNLNITHQPEELGVDDAVMVYADIEAGFVHSITDISFKSKEFETFIQELNEIIGEFTTYNYSRGKNNIYKKHFHDDVRIYVRGNSLDYYVSIYCKTEELSAKIWKVYNKHSVQDDCIDLYMHSYFMNGSQVDESTKIMKLEEINYISEKYYPYIDTQIMFDRFFTGAENILLLVGKPGLGKSKMSTLALKHAFLNSDKLPYDKMEENAALDNQYISVGYVKSTEVLAQDKFWRTLEKSQLDIVIIDDLDYMLTKRDSEVQSSEDVTKNAFLNQFLSFTDGVDKNKTKFIITTNQSYDDIDTALLRKGRLFDILELRHLDKHEALEIWLDNDLDESLFNETFRSHEVLPAELGSEINKRLNTRIETACSEYLKEDGISKVQKAGRSKKIGL